MSDAKNTLEIGKTKQSTKFSQEFEIQMLSMLEKLIPKDIQKVDVITKPYSFGRTKLQRESTTLTSIPNTPQIQFTNPLDDKNRITAITIIPDDSFKTKGLLRLNIGEVTVLQIDTAGYLTDLNNLPLTIPNEGWQLRSEDKIELYIWTSDGTASAATLIVHFQR